MQCKTKPKNSVGIWAFGGNATRFMPSGYHPDAVSEPIVDKTSRAVEGLDWLVDGFEFHYPTEVNEDNLENILRVLAGKDLYAVALGLFCMPKFALGSFINPQVRLRSEALAITKGGVDLAAKVGAKFIIWPGGEGYNYPFQAAYEQVWDTFIDGIAEVVDYAAAKGVTVFLEHKNSEPAMKILMRDLGMTMYVVQKVREKGVDTSRLKINMDWQHLIMNGEPLAEYACILHQEGLLGHQHANSGWGNFDDDNMVGASVFMQTLALAKELQRLEYGSLGERIGYDLFPYTEDQVAAVKRSILQWEYIWSLAEKVDTVALTEAQKNRDSVAAYETVYAALGLDDTFIAQLKAERAR